MEGCIIYSLKFRWLPTLQNIWVLSCLYKTRLVVDYVNEYVVLCVYGRLDCCPSIGVFCWLSALGKLDAGYAYGKLHRWSAYGKLDAFIVSEMMVMHSGHQSIPIFSYMFKNFPIFFSKPPIFPIFLEFFLIFFSQKMSPV